MARHLLRLWRSYVFDTYTTMKKAHAQEFMENLNTVDADIRWTTEGEVETMITKDADEEIVWDMVERALAFLDAWSVISPDVSIKTKVLRKETYTNQYLNHPLEHKKGVVHTLLHRAEAIVSDPKDLEEEKAHIKQSLCWNGYHAWLLEGTEMPPLDQPAYKGVEENSLDPAPHQGWPSDPAVTTAVKPLVLDKIKKSYPVVIPYVKGVSEQMRRMMIG